MNIFKNVGKKLISGITVFISLVLGLLWWILDARTLVPLWVVFVVVLLSYLVVIIIYSLLKSFNVEIYRLPEVKNICFVEGSKEPIFIVEPNELYGQGALVTITFQEDTDSFETILGTGVVETINSQQCRQIKFYECVKTSNATKIIKNITPNKRKFIKIKPYVTKQMIEK